ncbi:hypothetical protein GGI35DRAFT_465444 [Trichoderma velutinum]
MAHFILRAGLAIWGLFCYVTALVYITCCHHAPPRSLTLNLVAAFNIIRVIGCSAQVVSATTGLDTAETIAIVADFFGLSLLLLAALDMLFWVQSSILKLSLNHPYVLFTIIIAPLYFIASLTLCIIGVTSASTTADTASQAVINSGLLLYLFVFIILTILVMGTSVEYRITYYRGESALFHALIASLPLLLLRLAYSYLIASKAFGGWVVNATLTSVLIELFMERIVEMAIVVLFLYACLPQRGPETRKDEEKLDMFAVEDQYLWLSEGRHWRRERH